MVVKGLKIKNDQLRGGDEVVISQLSGPACSVELPKRYLGMFKDNISYFMDLLSRLFIFSPTEKNKKFTNVLIRNISELAELILVMS